MGCFNSTCNLSGLQIYHGDKIKLVVTIPGPEHRESSLVYPSDLRTPCFLPVTGEYDDYGCIENVPDTDPSHKLVDSYFKELKTNKFLKYTDRYSKQYEEPMYANSKWYKFIGMQAFRVGRYPHVVLKKKDDGVFLSYSIILQEVWDEYTATFDRGGKIRTRAEESLDRWFRWYSKIAAEVLANPDKPGAMWVASRWGRDARYHSDETIKIPAITEIESLSLSFMSDNARDLDSVWFTELYFENFLRPLFMAKAFETEKGQRLWKWFRDTFVDFAVMSSLMHCLPRFWMPTMYAGQERDYKLHTDITAAAHRIAKKRYTKHKRENGE